MSSVFRENRSKQTENRERPVNPGRLPRSRRYAFSSAFHVTEGEKEPLGADDRPVVFLRAYSRSKPSGCLPSWLQIRQLPTRIITFVLFTALSCCITRDRKRMTCPAYLSFQAAFPSQLPVGRQVLLLAQRKQANEYNTRQSTSKSTSSLVSFVLTRVNIYVLPTTLRFIASSKICMEAS